MRIKLIKSYKPHNKGDIINVSREKGAELIQQGIAIATKDMSSVEVHHG